MHMKYSSGIHSIFSTQYFLLKLLIQIFYRCSLPAFISLVAKRKVFEVVGFKNYNMGCHYKSRGYVYTYNILPYNLLLCALLENMFYLLCRTVGFREQS